MNDIFSSLHTRFCAGGELRSLGACMLNTRVPEYLLETKHCEETSRHINSLKLKLALNLLFKIS